LLKIKRFIVREEGDVERRRLKILSKREKRQKGKKTIFSLSSSPKGIQEY
jgi:hypothetical protein